MKSIKKKKHQSGFSLVECVIALTVLALITAVAIETVSITLKVSADTAKDYKTYSFCEDIVECYKAYGEGDKFRAAMTKFGFEADAQSLAFQRATVEWSITDGVLTVRATESEAPEKTLFSLTYQKG